MLSLFPPIDFFPVVLVWVVGCRSDVLLELGSFRGRQLTGRCNEPWMRSEDERNQWPKDESTSAWATAWFPLDSRGLEQGLGEGLEGYLMNLAR